MNVQQRDQSDEVARSSDAGPRSHLIDWFAEGQRVSVEFAGTAVTIRYVGRKGRRARIAITGPAGTVFRAPESSETVVSRGL